MEQVPIRVLNQQTAGVMARVERGETVEITRQGKVIGRIVPVVENELEDLVVAGQVVPPTMPGPFMVPDGIPGPEYDAGALISAMRDEERW
ncbi:MAG TPA: type II toxin-antitoxin system prevent-host-death family antitoxin [Pseudonocardiaceae bacterium]